MDPALAHANRRISAIAGQPYGLARSQAAEQVVRRIDADGPPQALAYALATLVDSLVWNDEVHRAFVPFTRHVRWWDEHPEMFDEDDRHALFWSFKWMVGHVSEFPDVPAAQIEATLADMERRYRLEGLGRNAVAHLRVFWAMDRDDPSHGELYEQWVTTPRDDYSQCQACEPGDRAAYLIWAGRTDEAIGVIEHALTESPSCATEPADMLSRLALAYLDTGRLAEAAAAHRRCLSALTRATGSVIGPRGRVVELLARAGHRQGSVRRVEADWPDLVAVTPGARLEYLRHAGTALRIVAAREPDLPVDVPDVTAATAVELEGVIRAEAEALAAAFDARNGTDANARSLARSRTVDAAPEAIDLSVLSTTAPGPTGPVPSVSSGTPEPDVTESTVGHRTTLDRAMAAADADDLEAAARLFQQAGAEAESAGLLREAGLALADAAACAARLQDTAGAHVGFEQADALLRAGGADPDERAPVLAAWAEAAAGAGRAAEPIAALEELLRGRDGPGPDHVVPGSDLDPGTAPISPRNRALLVDALARLLATQGARSRAATLAERAAEAFADAGATVDAAHAFWLAGRLHGELGDPGTAVWHLESALEGFTLSRLGEQRAEVAGELITALRAVGRDDDADAVTR